jgi:hypothetical protein
MRIKIKNKKLFTLENFVKIIIIGLMTLNICVAIFASKDKYLKFNFREEFKQLKVFYADSQYISKNPKYIIPDETINAYAGWEYLKGVNPVLIAADTPPLGRYMIGLSGFIFNNVNIITIIFSVLSLFLMYLVGKQIFKSSLFALIPPLLSSFELIFKNQIIYSPLLDIFQLVFLLSIFYFFNNAVKGKRIKLSFVLVSVFIGLFISTKFFITGITIVFALILVLILNRDFKKLKILLLTLPISIFILLLSYSRVLAFGYSFREILGIQKYVYIYHKSQLILPFTIWPLILLNKWFVWYGDKKIISDSQWLITWPIITITSIIAFFLYPFKKIKRNKSLEILLVWAASYLLFFSIGQITPRYLVILIPVLYMISTYVVEEIFVKYYKQNKL